MFQGIPNRQARNQCAPNVILDNGRSFFLDQTTWENREVTDAQLEAAANVLMGIGGRNAIVALVSAIERLGPKIGSEIVSEGLNLPAGGPGAQNWTKLFIYAWKHHGIHRYMSKPDGTGRSR